MQQVLQPPDALPLAQVQSPTGTVWYVPYAQRYGDFLVQRRYKGTGKIRYSGEVWEGVLYLWRERVKPELVPYLNPGAVQAAGLDIGSIMAWDAKHPGQIFTHPTYGPLCLHWGDNSHSYVVTAAPATIVEENSIPFTPYTCSLTGRTYYQVQDRLEEGLLRLLTAKAGLLPHERELGLEGNWTGCYLTDLELATRVLAASQRQLVLGCAHRYYGVWTYPEIAPEMHWLNFYEAAEDAIALFQCLPQTREQRQPNSTAMWGYALTWPGREPVWYPVQEKYVPKEYASDLYQRGITPIPRFSSVESSPLHEIGEAEMPLTERIQTLTELLDAAALSRWQIARQMNLPSERLLHLELHAGELTLAEAKQLARILEVDEDDFLINLRHELCAREATEKQQALRLKSQDAPVISGSTP